MQNNMSSAPYDAIKLVLIFLKIKFTRNIFNGF